jgi:LacI family transcriptional regulator
MKKFVWENTETLSAAFEPANFSEGPLQAGFRATLARPDGKSTDTIASDDKVLVKALRFIRDHAHERIDATRVIQHVGLARSSVETRFRSSLGRTIKSEITRARVNRAAILLRETTMNLDEIAHACGFATASHFLRIFKQVKGVTPGAFRSNPTFATPPELGNEFVRTGDIQ